MARKFCAALLKAALVVSLFASCAQAQTRSLQKPVSDLPKKRIFDKKFVFGWLLPHAAATVLAAEGASCLHRGANGVLVRHSPCGRSRSYPIYMGLGVASGIVTYTWKRDDLRDEEAGRSVPKAWRWQTWSYVWTGAMVPQAIYLLTRPSVAPQSVTATQQRPGVTRLQ